MDEHTERGKAKDSEEKANGLWMEELQRVKEMADLESSRACPKESVEKFWQN